MTRGYFKKLLKYMKGVYGIEDELRNLRDNRKNPKYQTSEVALPVLLGFLNRIESFNELKFRLERKDYSQIVSRRMTLPKIYTIRDTLKVINLDDVRKMHTNIIRKARRNKSFCDGTIDGYTVAAIDGTRLFGSYKKSCEECLSTSIKNGKKYYYHNATFLSTIGKEPRVILDYECYHGTMDPSNKDEGELTVAKRLLTRVAKTHKNLVDVIVYDALACNGSWINYCLDNAVIPIVRVKNSNIIGIKEVKKKIGKKDGVMEWEDKDRQCKVQVYEEEFYIEGVDSPLRFVKFAKQNSDKKRTQVMLLTTDFTIPLKTLYTMIHKRWDIENSIFNKMKTYAGMEHCYIHHPNAMQAILYFMIMSVNLTSLFISRRLSSKEILRITQKELIRLMEKEMHLMRYNEKYVFDTT